MSNQKQMKPGLVAIEKVIKSTPNFGVTGLELKKYDMDRAEGEGYAKRAKKITGVSNERRGKRRLRTGDRYKQNAAQAVVTSKNIFGFKKKSTCVLINCSLKGVRLASASLYKQGAVVQLEMEFFQSQKIYSCSAKVTHVKENQAESSSEGLQYVIGLKFLSIESDYKDFILKKSVRQKIRKKKE